MSINRTLTTVISGLLLMAVFLAGDKAAAQDPQLPLTLSHIGVFDIDKVRAQSIAFQKAMTQVKTYNDKVSAELDGENESLRQANDELGRKRTVLAPEAFAEERKKFEERVVNFQRRVQEHQTTIKRAQDQIFVSVDEQIRTILADVAKERKVVLILPAQAVIMRAEAMSMDKAVLDRLNVALPSLTVTLPTK